MYHTLTVPLPTECPSCSRPSCSRMLPFLCLLPPFTWMIIRCSFRLHGSSSKDCSTSFPPCNPRCRVSWCYSLIALSSGYLFLPIVGVSVSALSLSRRPWSPCDWPARPLELLGAYWTCSSPRCPLRSHSLVCTENNLFIVGIGPILNKKIELIFRSDRSDRTYVYT